MNAEEAVSDFFRIVLNSDFELSILVSPEVLITVIIIIGLLVFFRVIPFWSTTYEIDEAEFGVGNQKLKLKPNETDKQIAYKIWVELSTRKIGLEIDLEHDVVSEIYDSWYSFFSVTRELIKDVPVSKFKRDDTQKIIALSIDVLNKGIRPHLTEWQARFRRWYQYQLEQTQNNELHPQDIQKQFPEYEDLKRDILDVNKKLIKYREKMHELISNK